MRIINKTRSIYFQLVIVLILALAAAVLTFAALNLTINDYMCREIANSDYMKNKDREYIENLREYVAANNISMYDKEALDKWGKEHEINFFDVYVEDKWVYTGMFSEDASAKLIIGYYSRYGYNEEEYIVKFAEGDAIVTIYGEYVSKTDKYVLIGEVILCFLVFLAITIPAVRRNIRYICRLKEEVEILEGGNLEYKVTVSGNNELSELAESLDKMRKSFLEQIEKEKTLIKSNRDLVAEMSHDIRTPLTNLMLYLDIIKHGKYKDKQQMEQYICKASDKAEQIRQISDSLFEHATKAASETANTFKIHTFKDIFFDAVSDMTGYLAEEGFAIKENIEWDNIYVSANIAYINRVISNIASNIKKYADNNMPVEITSQKHGEYIGLMFSNRINQTSTKSAGAGIGLKSIQHLVDEMKGCIIVDEKEKSFSIYIGLPIA